MKESDVTEDLPSGTFGQDASSIHSLARTFSKTERGDAHGFETTDNYKSYTEKATGKQTKERDDALSPQKTLRDIESLLPDLVAVGHMGR